MNDQNTADQARSIAEKNGLPVEEFEEKKSVATQLVELAEDMYDVFIGDDGEPYAVVLDGPPVALALRGREGLRQRLARAFYVKCGKAAAASALADALNILEGKALEEDRKPVALRTARYLDAIVLDLGTADGRQVVCRPEGWTITGKGPVTFRRTALTSALPDPVTGGSLDPLRELLNVSDENFHLAIGWTVFGIVPDQPHPILALFGEQGTGKSNFARMLTQLLDPSPAPLRTAPRDIGDWTVTAAGSWVVTLDNISGIQPWFSDALCRAVTGDGLPKRALYTNSDISVVSFLRPIIMTSIDAGALAGDLAERLVPLELERIPREKRRTEEEVRTAFEEATAGALGALLDLLCKVLTVLPGTRPDELPRMADFTRFLEALDSVTGWTTRKTYEATFADLADQVIESDPFADAVRKFMEGQSQWEGTAAQLLELITPERAPHGWPKSPRAAGGNVKRITPALRTAGIRVDHTRAAGGNRARLIVLTNTNPNGGDGKQPSQPSEPSQRGADLPVVRDGSRDGMGDGRDGWTSTVPGQHEPSRQPSRDDTSADLHELPHGDGRDGRDGENASLLSTRAKTPCAKCGRNQWNALGSPYCLDCREAA
ncbi:ATP-binding protein [Streptomyces cellulosae]|uniref:ATP-binding protein n=1 Tax=Streptomyces cellulosae TaxID=1968 RepID=A0ABW6J9M6_STRCE